MKATLPPSPPPLWFSLAPLGLLVGLFGLVGLLWFSGALQTSGASARPSQDSSTRASAAPTPYRVSPVSDEQPLRKLSGHLGFWNEPAESVQILRYRGGLLECFLEVQENGQTAQGTPLPESWPSMFQNNADLARPDSKLPQEGYIAIARMKSTPLEQVHSLQPVLVGLGSLPTAGPFPALASLHTPVTRPQTYRILLQAGPGIGQTGPGFNIWSSQTLLPRGLPIAANQAREARPVGGENLPHNEPVTLWEQREGGTTLRLRGRFLSLLDLVQQRELAMAPSR